MTNKKLLLTLSISLLITAGVLVLGHNFNGDFNPTQPIEQIQAQSPPVCADGATITSECACGVTTADSGYCCNGAHFDNVYYQGCPQGAIIWSNPANQGAEDGLTKATGYNTLWKAMAQMQSGDTVIIADGNWRGYSDMSITDGHLPPSGTSGTYSKIKAETDWEVILPFVHAYSSRSYLEIRGIVFDRRPVAAGHVVNNWNHTKFIRCGFLAGPILGNAHTAGFGSGDSSRASNHHNLMEECIAWGGGRYVFYNKYGQYNIFRRCVARHDMGTGYAGTEQVFNFRAYASDYSIYQNDISIDSDRPEAYPESLNDQAGGFWLGDNYGATGNEIQGSISIKDVILPFYFGGSAGLGTSSITNSTALDTFYNGGQTLTAFVLKSETNLNGSNILGMYALGIGQDGYYGKNAGTFTIKNSILKNVGDCGVCGAAGSYINHYNVTRGAYGEGSTTYDPEENGLLYPVRIEEGSPLSTAGENGTQVGPTILKKIGRPGTLYGEEGWDEVTDEDLWPWPNEDKIKELMSVTVEGVPGIYGFTAYVSPFGSPNTLTSYIWEYLGNKIPCEIYNTCNNPPQPNITLTKTATTQTQGQAIQGEEITYTITYTNTGTATANNIVITDNIPNGTTYVPASATNEGVYGSQTNQLTWTIASLTAGGQGSVEFKTIVE